MKIPEIYWSLRFTRGFQNSYRLLSDFNIWRVDAFIRNVIYVRDPTKIYEHTPCKNCPPNFLLFGISDDGLGHKGVEIQVWLDTKTKTIWFLKCTMGKKK